MSAGPPGHGRGYVGHQGLASALSGRDFMILPGPLREHLPQSMVGVPLLDDLPTVDRQLAWPRDAPAAVAALVDTARRLARAEGWLPARRAGRARTYKTAPEPAP
ncbi:hypothetical protein [Streptomyces sp. NBC_01506]|uniref:hypothetical protein n=1 Tax=Streptomyces sp. NBC_01506 TaxID=2903887 RepID=UPI00386A64F5